MAERGTVAEVGHSVTQKMRRTTGIKRDRRETGVNSDYSYAYAKGDIRVYNDNTALRMLINEKLLLIRND